MVSSAFEPKRRSSGGSVFLKVFFRSQENTGKWMKLGDLRENKIQEHFNQLAEKYQAMKKEKDGQQNRLFHSE